MTMAIYDLKTQDLVGYSHNEGVSQEAKAISKNADKLTASLRDTFSFGDRISQLLEGLLKLKYEYSTQDWDGYGGEVINQASFQNALKFAMALPQDLPLPETDVLPTGKIIYTWHKSSRQTFSVIIGSLNDLHYAGLYGAVKKSGITYLEHSIQKEMREYINRVFD